MLFQIGDILPLLKVAKDHKYTYLVGNKMINTNGISYRIQKMPFTLNAVIDTKKLYNILKTYKDHMTVNVEKTDQHIIFKVDKGIFKLSLIENDLDIDLNIEDRESLELPNFKSFLSAAKKFIPKNDEREYLNGINTFHDGTNLNFATCNGHAIVVYKIKTDMNSQFFIHKDNIKDMHTISLTDNDVIINNNLFQPKLTNNVNLSKVIRDDVTIEASISEITTEDITFTSQGGEQSVTVNKKYVDDFLKTVKTKYTIHMSGNYLKIADEIKSILILGKQ